MKTYEYLRQRVIGLPNCDGCSVNIILVKSDEDFKVAAVSVHGPSISGMSEITLTCKDEAITIYEQLGEQFSADPRHLEQVWA